MTRPSIVWLYRELRTHDLPALAAAAARGGPVIPVYIAPLLDEGRWATGAAARWWLHESLRALAEAFAALGSPLVLRRGPVLPALRELVQETGADHVFTTTRVEPAWRALQADVCAALPCTLLPGDALWPAIRTRAGGPYRVFTPFARACGAGPQQPAPLPPQALQPPASPVPSLAVVDLDLVPQGRWVSRLSASWAPGEPAARQALHRWVTGSSAAAYDAGRDRPDQTGTAQLSASLAFGEVSAREAWYVAGERLDVDPDASSGLHAWRRQLLWRDFARHLAWHYPHTMERPLRPAWEGVPWRDDPVFLQRWHEGRTGFEFVDAAMRELWHTGWMHNRARMVVASFLVKDGLVAWPHGARWFWDSLVDADLPNNSMGWQWAAGCGADAAPFFRIFNPKTQAKRHDPDGQYVRRWMAHGPGRSPLSVPPWSPATSAVAPIVDHKIARERALGWWRVNVRKPK